MHPILEPKLNISIMRKIKKAKTVIGMDDYMKAVRKADREAEMQLLGPGFHSMNRIHRSKKSYSRKEKHRGSNLNLDASFLFVSKKDLGQNVSNCQ